MYSLDNSIVRIKTLRAYNEAMDIPSKQNDLIFAGSGFFYLSSHPQCPATNYFNHDDVMTDSQFLH